MTDERDDIEAEREKLRLERERLRHLAIQTEIMRRSLILQHRAYRRANRSWYQRFEDALFDW